MGSFKGVFSKGAGVDRAYAELNKRLFKNKLPPINFIPNPSEKYILHLRRPNVIEVGNGFANAEPRQILDELLHVMIHLENIRLGVADYTHNQYHRREFCEMAVSLGLIVVWHKTRGWGITSSDPNSKCVKAEEKASRVSGRCKVRYPEPAKSQHLAKCYDDCVTLLNTKQMRRQILTDAKQKRVFQLKYVCHCKPPVIIRSGRRPDGPNPLDVWCNVCGAKFVIEVTA